MAYVYSAHQIEPQEFVRMTADEITVILSEMRKNIARECELAGDPLLDGDELCVRLQFTRTPKQSQPTGRVRLALTADRRDSWPSTELAAASA